MAEKLFIYRWWEGEAGPFEIQGHGDSIYQVAKRLELPPRKFRSEFLNQDGTAADPDDLVMPLG